MRNDPKIPHVRESVGEDLYGAAGTPPTSTSTKAQPNEHGVTWATSRSGELQIAVGPDKPVRHTLPDGEHQVQVWAVRTGTHDVTAARNFTGPSRVEDARAYANRLWRTR
jgi:hypothetical protein